MASGFACENVRNPLSNGRGLDQNANAINPSAAGRLFRSPVFGYITRLETQRDSDRSRAFRANNDILNEADP
ncbi:MAG: hypothetical protein HBSAPP02_04440 [Phycisphaerae bacterium]|nr:MAG: hypothetical protein HBSAPP02_04440 [Phycisphaerae bacterium]